MMKMNLYTKEQVHQIIDSVLLQMDKALPDESEPKHLENDIPQKASPSNTKISLTVSEAAQMIGISKPKMYELVRAGKVHSVNIGKKILISRDSLQNWLKEGDSNGKKAC